MTDPARQIRYVCCDPDCELAAGVFGAEAADIERASVQLAKAPKEEESGEESAELPCPRCAEAEPPRNGRLLAVPEPGHSSFGAVVASVFGPFKYWVTARAGEVIEDSAERVAEFVGEKADGETYVPGPKVVTGVVLRTLPFDGHVLAHGNRDAFTGRKWDPAEPRYGVEQAPPLPAARAEPTYVRELQKDLVLLGYLSKNRVPRDIGGVFDVHTLGAVLAFKQDLVEIYGIPTVEHAVDVSARDLRSKSFDKPILGQSSFVSPARMLNAWARHLRGGRGLIARLTGVASLLRKRKLSKRAVEGVTERLGAIEEDLDALPFRVVLEDPAGSYAPFVERKPTLAPAELAPASGTPAHDDVRSLLADPAFDPPGFNSRRRNRAETARDAKAVIGAVEAGLSRVDTITQRLGTAEPADDAAASWAALGPRLAATLAATQTVLELLRFAVLNLSVQMRAWIEHLVAVGIIDRPTAVYLKTLREGGRIGPRRRAAYRLALNPEDFDDVDAGATFIREECRGRGSNRGAKRAVTMPEILVLQFFANESGMQFTTPLKPFNLSASDKDVRFPKLGVDWNSARKGTFDPVNSTAGDWVYARGWGIGQETERNTELDGVELRRGLPVLPPESTEVRHPKPFADKEASFDSVLDRKAIARFNKRSGRRDCTYGEAEYPYYDCHGCLKRFFDLGLVGQGESGSGGVIVPRSAKTFGDPSKAAGFWVDLERVTEFARAGGATFDPARRGDYLDLFGFVPPPSDEATLEVLSSGTVLASRVKEVARARGLDPDALRANVVAHMDARRDLPCSWCHVRIRYAGTGGQAFGALQKMLRIVGNLDTSKDVVKRHIQEASEIRVKEHEDG